MPHSSSCPRRSLRLAGLQEADTTTQVLSDGIIELVDLSKEVSTAENSVDKNLVFMSQTSSSPCPRQSVGPAELQGDTDQAEAIEQVLLNDDSQETGTELLFDQEISNPTCPRQSIGRAELQDNSDQVKASAGNAQQSDFVTETEDAPQVKEGNDLYGLNFNDLALSLTN